MLIKDSLFIWNDFQLPLIILNGSTKSWTLQLFQYNFKSQYSFDYNLAFASFIMTMLPILILYILIQKNIVAGLSAGAVKGSVSYTHLDVYKRQGGIHRAYHLQL